MPKTLGRSFWILALLVVAIGSWQWLENRPAAGNNADSTLRMAETESDYYLQDFHITNVDNDSGRVYELTGQSLSHHSDTGNSSISQPAIKVFGKNKTHWQGSAQHGDISPDFRKLALFGAVKLAQFPNLPAEVDPALLDPAQADSQHKPAVEVTSASVKIDTTKQIIATDDPVTIKSDLWSLSANRMRADINDDKLLFDSGMEAEYLLQQR